MPVWALADNTAPRNTAMRLALFGVMSVALVLSLCSAGSAQARYNEQVQDTDPGDTAPNPWTDDLKTKVGIVEKLNSPVPLDLELIDEDGEPVSLDTFFTGKRPVVINLGYSRCPSICVQMRSELTDKIGETDLALGEDFIILNISIDPKETPEQSQAMRDDVFEDLQSNGVDAPRSGWRFLTGDQETIAELTEALGYRYIYIPPQDEYGHPGVLVLVDGSGKIRRYLSGTAYTGKTLGLSLVETSDGKVGSLLDKAFLTCFSFDPEANNYTATAKFIMMTGGVVIIVMVLGLVLAGFAYEKRRRELDEQDQNKNGPGSGLTMGSPDPA